MTNLHSVRLLVRRGGDGGNADIECIAENGGHFRIEAETGDNGALVLQLTVRTNAHPVGPERDDMHGAKEAPACDPVDGQFPAISQVNVDSPYGLLGHFNQSFSRYPLPAFEQHIAYLGKGEGPR